jgi:ribosome-associated protein YbcJ (S4-like RNA binding protein)
MGTVQKPILKGQKVTLENFLRAIFIENYFLIGGDIRESRALKKLRDGDLIFFAIRDESIQSSRSH